MSYNVQSSIKSRSLCTVIYHAIGIQMCASPRRRCRFSCLPLDFGLLAQTVTQSLLYISRDVWRCLADLHGRLQNLNRAAAVDLYFWYLPLLILLILVLDVRWLPSHSSNCIGLRMRRNRTRHWRWGRGGLGQHPQRAAISMGWESLASPNGPAQLPKDKERDYQKGEPTETYDQS